MIRRWAVGLLILAICLRAWVVVSGYFYWDDFILSGRSAQFPLTSTDYLLYNHDGHLMPGGWALQWIVNWLAPLQFWLPALLMIGGQAGVWWLWFRLFRSNFGMRWRILPPLLLLWFSSLTLPSDVWWSAALNSLPMQAALIIGSGAILRAQRGEVGRSRVILVASFVFGLVFFEKGLILLPAYFGLAMVVSEGTIRKRIAAGFRLMRPAWVAMVLIAIAYFVGYSLASSRGLDLPVSFMAAVSAVVIAFYTSTLPALVGGPWSWRPTGFSSALAAPPPWMALVAAQLVVLAVAVTGWLSRRARVAWLWAALYLLADVMFVIFGRLREGVSPEILGALRYTSDGAVIVGLALGLAIMPLIGEKSPGRLEESVKRLRGAVTRKPLKWPPFVSIAVANVLFLGALGSTVGFGRIWAANPAREYISSAERSMAAADPNAPLLPQAVPEFVLYGLAYPYNQTDSVFAPVSNRPPFGQSTGVAQLFNDAGELVPAKVEGPSTSESPAVPCRYKVAGNGATVTFPLDIVDFEHTVQIDYLSGGDSPMEIAIGSGAPAQAQLSSGLGTTYVRVSGGGASIRLGGLEPGVVVCVDRIRVGRLVPTDKGSSAEGSPS